ncbi:MAG: T9SS type A sorting domain-containing protein [Chitinophagales bacterium]
MKKMYIIIALLLIAGIMENSFAQNLTCGTDEHHQFKMQTDSAYQAQYNLFKARLRDAIQNPPSNQRNGHTYTIPVVVHVIHLGEPIGVGSNISDAQIHDAIQGLNDRFGNNNIGSGVDTEIEFCLATNDPNGLSTDGINRVNGAIIPGYYNNGMERGSCSGGDEEDLKDLSKWPVSDYYNIWVVHDICGNVAGFAYFPSTYPYNGTVIVSDYMNYSYITLAHELGHGLSLYHTFQDDGIDAYCPTDNDCTSDGDGVCDTPPHKRSDCGSSNPCTSSGDWDNSRYNYMSYCSTRDRFTQGQKDRMQAVLQVYPRASLLTSSGCYEPCMLSSATVEASCHGDNTGSATVVATGGTPGYTYTWNTNPPQNSPTATGLSAGTYKVTLTDAGGCSDSTTVTVTETPQISFSTSSTDASCNGENDGSASVMNVTGGTTIQSIAITEDWEGSHSWTFVNGTQSNQWLVGSATSNGGTNSAYISNNASSNTYTITSGSIVHFYKDFTFPADASDIQVEFDWKGNGESNYDYMRVYLVDTTTNPAAGSMLSSGLIGSDYNMQATWDTETISGLDANAGTTKRLVFTWRNDGSVGTQPPPAVDNITVSYEATPSQPYTYEWSTTPAQNSETIDNLAAGSYTVTVTDGIGCTNSSTVMVSGQPEVATTSITPSGGGNNGAIVLAVSNGSEPYSYNWSNGDATRNISDLTAGYYTLTVMDDNGCTATHSVSVPVNVSIIENGLEETFQLYPNPVAGNLYIKAELKDIRSVRVQITDALGRTVYRQEMGRISDLNEVINLSENADGIYFIRLFAGNESVTKRVVLHKF